MPLNIEMLDLIGCLGGHGGGYAVVVDDPGEGRPPIRSKVFDRIARDGWQPRQIAIGAELERLEQSTTRGHCLEPLIREGDTVYIDRDAQPLPGDIVSFQLSERFAAEQNANLPEFDARPCKAGDPWLKLFVPFGGIDMLFERYGHYMTTTWAACESPDDTPVLHPVRNIRRAGRLLFLPETFSSEIGANAATVTIINASSSAGSGISGFTGLISTGVVVNGTGVSPGYNCTAIVTATIQARQTVGAAGQIRALLRFADNGTSFISASHEEPIPSSTFGVITLQWQFNHVASNKGLGQAGIWFDNTGASTNSFDWQSATLQVEYIIR